MIRAISYFPPHDHPGGEEILVLDGVFSEANEHYSAVTYMRSPPGSSHQPYSKPGALSDGETIYPAGSWLRLPQGSHEQFVTSAEGATYYQKIGQLGVTSPGILDVD